MIKRTKKRLIQGVDTFKTFIDNNGYFVDKTLLIKEILDCSFQTILLPRPRRFGKSLNLSMLHYFFDITLKDTKDYFTPYKIWQEGEYYTQHQGQYPVIQISLKGMKKYNFEDCLIFLKEKLSNLYRQHTYLLQSKSLDEFDKADFRQIITKQASVTQYELSLRKLSEFLYKHHQRPVVILIDEYDSPIHVAYQHGYYKEIVGFMKTFLGEALKTNPALYKGVITGILRVSKESIFSDLNNLGAFTVLDDEFSDKFGFVKDEIIKILDYFNLKQYYEEIKLWYNGYTIGLQQSIYNPWSIISFVGSKHKEFKPHWINTSSVDLIKNMITAKNAKSIRSDVEQLLLGQNIRKWLSDRIVFSDFESNRELIWSLLVFSGYLTIGKKAKNNSYELRIPNYEIQTLFRDIIRTWLDQNVKVRSLLLVRMIDSLTTNRIKAFEKYFTEVMGDTISYFDTDKNEAEKVWQAYVLGLLALASDEYIIKSNRESGEGRYDILMLPKDKTQYGVVIEVKAIDKKASQKQIDTQLAEALEQIEQNEYHRELLANGIEKRVEIAMVFTGKKVFLKAKE